MLPHIKEWFLCLVYPRRCPVCDCVLPVGDRGICPSCHMRLEYVQEPRCKKCGKPLQVQEDEFCTDCEGRETSYEYGFGLWVYNSAMQASISRFKYHGRREYGECYAQELYRCFGAWIKETGAGALIPVPIHRNRYRKRGYNQAELIAKGLGKLAGIPVRENFLLRCRDTTPQKELTDRERQKNLQDAFHVNNFPEELNHIPECVIIIDDIYTTGGTLEACSKVIKEAGVQRIYFICVCIGKGY